jgi:hypothetical protein
MMVGANRIRGDAFLVLTHYPLFTVTMVTVKKKPMAWHFPQLTIALLTAAAMGFLPILRRTRRIWRIFCMRRTLCR